ncbi:MAG TPA: PAS domain S-box protein, partial [Longimicrobiaceae bacterium]
MAARFTSDHTTNAGSETQPGRALAAARLAARALALPVAFAYDDGALRVDAGEVEMGDDARAALGRLCARVTGDGDPLCLSPIAKSEGAAPLKALAAVPLAGGCIGVADVRARRWTSADRAALDAAAALAAPSTSGAASPEPAGRSSRRGLAVFRAMFEGSATGLVVLDLGGHILRANRALARMLGVPPARLFGHPLAGFIAGDDRAATELRAALAEGREAEPKGDVRLAGRGGREAWVRVRL